MQIMQGGLEMENYDELILEITSLVMKANRITNHDFFLDYSGHVNVIEIYYLENGYKKGAPNRIDLLYQNVNRDNVLENIEKCKNTIIALIEGSKNNG